MEQLGQSDSGKDKRDTPGGARVQPLSQHQVRSDAGKDRLEREDQRRVGGRKELLRPGLNRESDCSGEDRRDQKGDDQPRGSDADRCGVPAAASLPYRRHRSRSAGVASWARSMRDEVCAREMTCRANPSAQPSERRSPTLILANCCAKATPAGVVNNTTPVKASSAPSHAFRRGACIVFERSQGIAASSGTSTTTIPVMNADLGRGGARQAGCLKLVTRCQACPDHRASDESRPLDVAKAFAIDQCQAEECERHAQKIEEQGRCVLERILDQHEGRAPNSDDREQEQVRAQCLLFGFHC